MIKTTGLEIHSKIDDYLVSAKNGFIKVWLSTGIVSSGEFISDGRKPIEHTIRNEPASQPNQVDTLTVDAAGQVTLSRIPVDNNQILINDVPVDHVAGQIVTCDGYVEGDELVVSYYYTKAGRNWFDEQKDFVKEDHPEYLGMDDYNYNKTRIGNLLLEMGLVSGEVV